MALAYGGGPIPSTGIGNIGNAFGPPNSPGAVGPSPNMGPAFRPTSPMQQPNGQFPGSFGVGAQPTPNGGPTIGAASHKNYFRLNSPAFISSGSEEAAIQVLAPLESSQLRTIGLVENVRLVFQGTARRQLSVLNYAPARKRRDFGEGQPRCRFIFRDLVEPFILPRSNTN